MQHRISRRHAALLAGLAAVALTACTDTPTAAPDAALGRNAAARTGAGEWYIAKLVVLNARAQTSLDPDKESGVAHGEALFHLLGDELTASVHARGAEPGMIHPQHIHAADRCPSGAADVNHDGFVDVIEGLPFYGPILVPLDNDLADVGSQVEGFPMAFGKKGLLDYEASGSRSAIEAALGEPLDLDVRHVVLHGVDPATPLPSSVASLPGLPAYLTLPVACGEIRRRSTG